MRLDSSARRSDRRPQAKHEEAMKRPRMPLRSFRERTYKSQPRLFLDRVNPFKKSPKPFARDFFVDIDAESYASNATASRIDCFKSTIAIYEVVRFANPARGEFVRRRLLHSIHSPMRSWSRRVSVEKAATGSARRISRRFPESKSAEIS
jgi:hypothetical protein